MFVLPKDRTAVNNCITVKTLYTITCIFRGSFLSALIAQREQKTSASKLCLII